MPLDNNEETNVAGADFFGDSALGTEVFEDIVVGTPEVGSTNTQLRSLKFIP